MRSEDLKGIFLEIERDERQIIADTCELISKPSVAARHECIEECATLVQTKLKEIGAKTEILRLPEANPIVFGQINSNSNPNKTVLFYLHYDVQPAEPIERWKTPPFVGCLYNGRIYGRGAHDDKGEIATRFSVARSFLNRRNGDPPCNIKFLIEGEEEIGSKNLAAYSKQFQDKFQADAIIWEFGGVDEKERPLVTLGVKGILYVEFLCRKAAKDLHSKYAAIVESPAWELVWALSKIKTRDDRIQIPGWYDDVRPFSETEMNVLRKQQFAEEDFKQATGIQRFINARSGEDLVLDLIGKPTANIAGLMSGYAQEGPKTVLPSEAIVKMDFRLVPDQDPKKLYILLEKYLHCLGFDDLNMRILQAERAARTPVDSPIVRHAAWAAKQVFDKDPVIEISSPATGPMDVFARINKKNFQCVAIGSSHPDSMPHSPNENQRVDLLIKGAKWVAATVMSIVEASTTSNS
jgi:acetylornithine deacetylase/succinyl-diaminopimelate desuccinylase-like protein